MASTALSRKDVNIGAGKVSNLDDKSTHAINSNSGTHLNVKK